MALGRELQTRGLESPQLTSDKRRRQFENSVAPLERAE